MNRIEKLVPGGQGITADTDGKKGFFWNALPGETVTEYTITKKKSHYFEAIAEKIENPSPHRITPKDGCYLATSPWQIMDYAYELEQKRELLIETFRQHGLLGLTEQAGEQQFSPASAAAARTGRSAPVKTGGAERTGENSLSPTCEIDSVQTDSKDFYYRNKMEYSLYWDIEESKIKLAQHQRGSHRKLPLTTSSIERPEIWKEANAIVDDLNSRHEEARKYQSLLLRCDQAGHVSGGLYENRKPHPVFENLTDTILGHEYSYSPNGFFQINLPVYEMALRKIKKYVDTDKVLDLYSGVGTIGLSVARNKDLTLVECNGFAYKELVENCEKSRLAEPFVQRKNCEEYSFAGSFAPTGANDRELARNDGPSDRCPQRNIQAVLSNSEDALDYIAPDQTVILDPPRAGCDVKLLEKLLETQPQTIIYLSCNPSTQARDLAILTGVAESGPTNHAPHQKYQIISVTPFNFFPRTPHLENLVILKRT